MKNTYKLYSRIVQLCGLFLLILMAFILAPQPAQAGDDGGDKLDFDGVDDYLEVIGYSGVTGGGARTFEAWIETTGGGAIIIAEWGVQAIGTRWTVRLDAGRLRAEVEGGFRLGTSLVNDGQWHHIAVALPNDGSTDISETLLYVDGNLEVASGGTQAVNTSGANNVLVGDSYLGGTFTNFPGQLDNVRIWSVARTQIQIREAMFGDPSNTTGLEAYYKLDDGMGSSTAADSSGNGRTATLTNMTPASDWLASEAPIGDATVQTRSDLAGLWVAVDPATSGGLTFTDNSFLNDIGDDIIFGHNNINGKTSADVPTTGAWAGAPNPMRWSRTWYCDLNDQSSNGGTVDLTFDFVAAGMGAGDAPVAPASNYRLLERVGTSGQFTDLGGATSVNTGSRTVTFSGMSVGTLCSYITLGTLDDTNSPTAVTLQSSSTHTTTPVAALLLVLVAALMSWRLVRRRGSMQ